jgi:hypothetical protein
MKIEMKSSAAFLIVDDSEKRKYMRVKNGDWFHILDDGWTMRKTFPRISEKLEKLYRTPHKIQ